MTPKEAESISESIADIIWWLKGYMAAQSPESDKDIGGHHIEALRRVRVMLYDTYPTKDTK